MLHVSIHVQAFRVGCGACGASAYLASIDSESESSPLGEWTRAHHDPRLLTLFASVDGGPLLAHNQVPPRRLR